MHEGTLLCRRSCAIGELMMQAVCVQVRERLKATWVSRFGASFGSSRPVQLRASEESLLHVHELFRVMLIPG